ncbi:MAG TPA: hypothetical protein VMV53_00080 [Acidimicrobiales bacterium]|nr:hypothetical protein [Acidimicrobiales bacterium]
MHQGDNKEKRTAGLLPVAGTFAFVSALAAACKCARRRRRARRARHHDACEGHGLHGHWSHAGHAGHAGHGPGREDRPRGRGFDAARILDARFASGKIEEEEYLRRRRILKENS